MADLLSFLRPKKSRRASLPRGPALEPPRHASPDGVAAPQSCEVVDLASRRPLPFVWCPPLPPYVGLVLLGAAITTAVVSITADAWAAQVRVAAEAFENWSAT